MKIDLEFLKELSKIDLNDTKKIDDIIIKFRGKCSKVQLMLKEIKVNVWGHDFLSKIGNPNLNTRGGHRQMSSLIES